MPTSPQDTAPMSTLSRLWKSTYLPDYVGFVILLLGWITLAAFVHPFHRMFFINDLNISYPHAEVERVSVRWNFVYALFIPLGFLIVFNILTKASSAKHESTILPFAISLVLASFLTDTIKNAVGRPRPDLIARCIPHKGTKANVLVSIDVCTTPHESSLLQDGWRSFPSGHSSFAFAGLGFVSLWLAGQLHVFRHGTPGGRDLSRALGCIAPALGALMIAISRCEDYRHDVYDVCVGSALGMTVAWWSYRRHWPSLGSLKCDEPLPRPGIAEERSWQRIGDEEEGIRGAEDGEGQGRQTRYEMNDYE